MAAEQRDNAQAEGGLPAETESASAMLFDAKEDGLAGLETSEAAERVFSSRISKPVKIGIAVAVVGMFFLSFMLGKFALNPAEVVTYAGSWFGKLFSWLPDLFSWCGSALTDPSGAAASSAPPPFPELSKAELVLFRIRLPRILVVMLVGASLAISGASYQGMFKNPLTSPDLLGASAGASLGACIALLLGLSGEMVQLLAFIGGLLAVGLAVWLNKSVDYDPTVGLVLAGILVSTLFQSGMSLVKFMADSDDKLPTITFWLMGSFASISVRDLLICILPMLIGFVILLSQAWRLNVLSFGDEEARSMGVNTRRTRAWVIFASTLVTSASVAVAGVVGWIGLVIPHLARAIVGPNYKVLLPTSMFVGSAYLLIVDNIARLIATVEIPIGILTAIMGVPFFIVIFKHNMKGWRS